MTGGVCVVHMTGCTGSWFGLELYEEMEDTGGGASVFSIMGKNNTGNVIKIEVLAPLLYSICWCQIRNMVKIDGIVPNHTKCCHFYLLIYPLLLYSQFP